MNQLLMECIKVAKSAFLKLSHTSRGPVLWPKFVFHRTQEICVQICLQILWCCLWSTPPIANNRFLLFCICLWVDLCILRKQYFCRLKIDRLECEKQELLHELQVLKQSAGGLDDLVSARMVLPPPFPVLGRAQRSRDGLVESCMCRSIVAVVGVGPQPKWGGGVPAQKGGG